MENLVWQIGDTLEKSKAIEIVLILDKDSLLVLLFV